MIQFIEDHRDDHGVEPICRVLPIAPATFYDNMAKRAGPSRLSDRVKRDAERKPEIERVFEQNLKVYGVRKVWRQMHRQGFDIARFTVARLMQDIGIEGVIRGKRPRTTFPDKALPCPLDRVSWQFHASAPNVLWVSDFTFVARGKVLSMWPSSLMFLRGASLAGAQAAQPMQALFAMLCNRPFINAGQHKIN